MQNRAPSSERAGDAKREQRSVEHGKGHSGLSAASFQPLDQGKCPGKEDPGTCSTAAVGRPSWGSNLWPCRKATPSSQPRVVALAQPPMEVAEHFHST